MDIRAAGAAPRPGLPLALDAFVGRQRELASVRALLLSDDIRLLTLTGPGGVGKTRLALEVARAVSKGFPDGMLLVALAPVVAPDLVLPTIARAVGVVDGDAPLPERLRDRLDGRRVLLVIDNVEHLMSAAPLLPDLLRTCAGPRFLVTSRIALRVSGEHVFPVEPLPVPEPDEERRPVTLRNSPSVRLFLDRARAARANFVVSDVEVAAVARICRRLDGLPLAIELAAARAPVLRPTAMLERLDQRRLLLANGPTDVPPRLRTMRDAVAWSYDLLAPDRQALFRRLSICVGSFDLDLAAALARGWRQTDGYPFAGGRALPPALSDQMGKEPPLADGRWLPPALPELALDVVAGIEDLVAHSLVRPVTPTDGEARFGLLETIREYGIERLAAHDETEAVRHTHAAAVVAFGETSGLSMWGRERRRWVDRLEAELGNVRDALGWLATRPEPANQLSLRLAEALWPFWQTRGRTAEGRAWLESALARPGGTDAARAAALNVVGALAWFQGDDGRATAALHESLPVCRAVGHHAGTGRALFFLALVAWRQGDAARMAALTTEALTEFEAGNDLMGVPMCAIVLAVVARSQGDVTRAEALLAGAAAHCEAYGFDWGLATARYYGGELARDQGDLPGAAMLLAEGLRLYRDQGDPVGIGGCLSGLALIAETRGDDDRSARLLGAADALTRQASSLLPPTERATYEAAVARLRDRLGHARFAAAFAAGADAPLKTTIAEAERLAAQWQAVGDPRIQEEAVNLTPRQREILRLLVQGYAIKEIAPLLDTSPSNVYQHVKNLRERFDLQTQAELAAFAVRHSLV